MRRTVIPTIRNLKSLSENQLRFVSTSLVKLSFREERERDKNTQIVSLQETFDYRGKKDRDAFIRVLETFEKKRHKAGLVEFIRIATIRMKEFGVHEDVEMYKKLLNLLPKGPMVCTNTLLADTMFYPKHQVVILEMLTHMELYDVIPDREMHTILSQTFGDFAVPTLKYLRMMYWLPKFKNISPWPAPKPRPESKRDVAILAVKRIIGSVDFETEISTFSSMEDALSEEDTWIVSGISPIQQKLIHYHPTNTPIYVEGPFLQYISKKDSINYFVLRSEMPKNRRRRTFINPDDITNLRIPYLDPPTPETNIPEFSVHEQKNEIIFAIGVTGTGSSNSLLSWIRILQKSGNPNLGKIPILFRLKNREFNIDEKQLRLEASLVKNECHKS